jgi:hypothetical protein
MLSARGYEREKNRPSKIRVNRAARTPPCATGCCVGEWSAGRDALKRAPTFGGWPRLALGRGF